MVTTSSSAHGGGRRGRQPTGCGPEPSSSVITGRSGRLLGCHGVKDVSPRVLVVDDDLHVAEVVSRYLEREGFEVETVGNGLAAVDRATTRPPDLVVLDLMLPGIDGLEVCRQLRALAPVPVIMLTAKGQEADRVIGLDMGADDYLTKPFSPRELTSRVKAVLRRARSPLPGAGAPTVFEAGDLVVEVAAREARLAGTVVPWRPGSSSC